MSWGKRVPPSNESSRKPLKPTLTETEDEDIKISTTTPALPIAISRSPSPSQKAQNQNHQSFNLSQGFSSSSTSSESTFGSVVEEKEGLGTTSFTNDLKTSLLFQGIESVQINPSSGKGSFEGTSSLGESRRPSNATPSSSTSNSIPVSNRRIISNPYSISTATTTSPRSPLSNGAYFPHSQQSTSTSTSTSTLNLPPSPTLNNQRRRSSQLLIPLSPPRSRRISFSNNNSSSNNNSTGVERVGGGSFIGSYENSLLNGRMSSQPNNLPLPFLASIGVLSSVQSNTNTTGGVEGGRGGEAKTKIIKCPPHLNLKFAASFYPNPSSTSSSSAPSSSSTISPYVGTIDLESHYFSLLSPSTSSPSSQTIKIPKFPGYELPSSIGQIQLIIKNPHSTALKVFLIPFDLTGLSRDGRGGRTFLRQKSYAFEGGGVGVGGVGAEEGKERLKFAIHLQFCSPPTIKSTSNNNNNNNKKKKLVGEAEEPKYYLYGTVRVVFTSSKALDSIEKLRTVLEGPEGILTSSSTTSTSTNSNNLIIKREFAEYLGTSSEWNLNRKKLKELIKRDKLVDRNRNELKDVIVGAGVVTSSTVIGFNPVVMPMIQKKKKVKVFDPNHVEDDEEEEEENDEEEDEEEESSKSNRNTSPSTPITTTGPSFLSLNRPLLSTPPSPPPPLLPQSRLYSQVASLSFEREEREESLNHQALVLALVSSSLKDNEVEGK